jgi:hypothetical protein
MQTLESGPPSNGRATDDGLTLSEQHQDGRADAAGCQHADEGCAQRKALPIFAVAEPDHGRVPS